MGPITPDERAAVMAQSPLKGAYDETVDRESAYEILMGRAAHASDSGAAPSGQQGPAPSRRTWGGGTAARREAPAPRASNRQTMGEAVAKSAARSVTSAIGSSIGRALVRGVLGSLLKR
jgi:hypothetical protein